MNKAEIENELASLRKQVKQYKAWFRAIDKHAHFDFWFKNTKSQYTYVNPHFANTMGRAICELQNVDPGEIFEPGRLERVKTFDKQVMDDGYLKRIIPCDSTGQLQMHEEHRFAVRDEAGEPIGLGCFAFEVTEKSIAEETLDKAEKIANLCSWRWSSETNLLVSCSEQMADFLGVSITEAFEMFPTRAQHLVLPADRHVFKTVEDRMNGLSHDGYQIEYRMRRKDGDVIYVRETAEPFLTSESTKEYLGVMQDVTPEKLAEQALRQSNETLEAKVKRRTAELEAAKDKAEMANRVKSEFLATMGHELLTPMNGVLGFAEALGETKLNLDQKDLLEIIQSSGTSLVTILNNILDFARIETGHVELDSELFNLRDVICDVVSLLMPEAKSKGLEIKENVHPNVPQYLIGDDRRIRQILKHLIGNAIKFSTKGHVTIDVNAICVDGAAKTTLKVIDTGIGIPEDRLDIIFDQFTQVDQSYVREYGGTGLGLSIVRKIVEILPGGEISVESKLNEGSVFTVNLSLDLVDPAVINPETGAVPDFNHEVVLIVSDDAQRHQYLKEALESWNLKVVVTKRAKQAMALLNAAKSQNININIVLADERLSQFSGLEFVRAIKEQEVIADVETILLQSFEGINTVQNIDGLRTISLQQGLIDLVHLRQVVFDCLQNAQLLQAS